MKTKRFFRVCFIAVTVLSFCIVSSSFAWEEHRDLKVKVMTQNMNPGADIAAVAFAPDPITAISETITSLLNSRIPDRAQIVAEEIAQTKPDLIALQEATRWVIVTQSNGTMVLDQLEQLMFKLKLKGQHYKVAAAHELTSLDLKPSDFGFDPADFDLQQISYTDRDAVLVRSDLPQNELKVLGRKIREYDTLMEFQAFGTTIPVLRGWISVDLEANGSRFRFVATHLDSSLDEIYKPIQVAQADQLLAELKKSNFPVILTGDFNSDAEPTHFFPLDSTESYSHILMAGFSDTWAALHPNDPGYTWPLTIDSYIPEAPIERIDLVFTNGPRPISIDRIGVDPVDGLFASDHAGIVAEFNLLGRHTRNVGPIKKPINRAHGNPFQHLLPRYSHKSF